MATRHIDGMMTVAQLKRRLVKGAVYKDVTVRTDEGDVRRIGTLMVTHDMAHAMTPGGRGRFYFYDVLGTKGIYGFRPLGGPAHGRFPTRWETMFYGLGILNLLLLAAMFMMEGRLMLLPSIFGPLSIIFALLFTTTRINGMRAFHADGSNGGNGHHELRPARA